jgi:phenylalanyl-tRNA synthetase beta chain
VRVFEIGRIFLRDASVATTDTTVRGIHQPMRIAGLAYGSVDGMQWGGKAAAGDFFDAKGDVETLLSPVQAQFVAGEHPAMHPGRCARILVGGRDVGAVGELHPRWRQRWEFAQAPVLFELDLEAVLERPLPAFAPVPRFQPAERDIAMIVKDAVSHAAVMEAIESAKTSGLLRDAMLFDLYKPKQAAGSVAADEKSMAVRLTLGSAEATLTDEQIDGAVQAVIDSIATCLGGRLRG